MHAFKKAIILILVTVLLVTMMPVVSLAQGPIDPDHKGTVTIAYEDQENAQPIAGAQFDLYRVADVDEIGNYTMNDRFADYPLEFDVTNPEYWYEAADDFKGYVYADGLEADYTGYTDEEGMLEIEDMTLGIYLVVGYRATTADFNTYSASPYLLQLPAPNTDNGWDYEVTINPKSTKDINPEDDERDRVKTRKAIVKWDDEGYESIRPETVEVTLYADGKEYDTEVLTKEDNWRYVWDNLDSSKEWVIVETKVGDKAYDAPDYIYTISKTVNGITYLFVNKYRASDPGDGEITVNKKVTGTPATASTFSFVLTASDSKNPMPEGSTNGKKETTINGAGTCSFGKITFTDTGTYEYLVTETDKGEKGYTYDKNTYKVTYTVIRNNGKLIPSCVVTTGSGQTAEKIEFNNIYTPEVILPQTGQPWLPVIICLGAGVVCLIIGLLIRRKHCR